MEEWEAHMQLSKAWFDEYVSQKLKGCSERTFFEMIVLNSQMQHTHSARL